MEVFRAGGGGGGEVLGGVFSVACIEVSMSDGAGLAP